jgi:hypothetical protein
MVHFDIVDTAIAGLRHEAPAPLVDVGVLSGGVLRALLWRHEMRLAPLAHVRSVTRAAIFLSLALVLFAAL